MKIFTQTLKIFTLAIVLLGMSAGVMGQTVVLSENFDKFTKGQPNGSADGADISASLDTYTQTAGWSGIKVSQAGGSVKLGTSSILGWIQTPAIDLSTNGGVFTLEFKAMAWSGDATDFKIIINGTTTTISELPNSAAYSFKNYQVQFTGGTSNTSIRFEGKQPSRGRFFLEDLKIISGSSSTPSINANPKQFTTTTVNSNALENINLKGSNLTSDLTISGLTAPFSSTVSTITKEQAMAAEGFDIPVTFAPTTRGTHTGSLIISGGGLTESVTVNLSGFADGELTASDFDTTNPATTLSADFESAVNNQIFTAAGWNNINVKGDRFWQERVFTSSGTTDKYLQATAYSSTNANSAEFDIWLITPAIDFSNLPANSKFRFDQAVYGAGDHTSFKVFHIALSGANVVKTELTINKTATTDNIWVTNTDADISGITGVGFIAFNYNRIAGTTNSASYRVDNISLSVPTAIETPTLAEGSVFVSNGQVVVKAEKAGALIEVYNIGGQRLVSQVAEAGRNTFTLAKGQIYVVKIGNLVKKVVL